MANAKLSKATVNSLKEFGITATDEAAARKELLKRLKKESVTGVDDDPLDELIELYSNFHEAEEEEDEEVEEDEVEEEDDAEEVEEDEEDDEEEDEEEDDEEDEVDEAADEEDDEEEDEEEDDEEEDTKPVKKGASKAPVKKAAPAVPAKKVAPKAPAKKTEQTKKPAKAPAKKSRAVGENFSKDNEDHVEMLREPFLENDQYEGVVAEFKLLKLGFTAYVEGKSAKRALFSYDRLKIVDGAVVGDLFFNALKGREEVEENVDLGSLDKEFRNFNLNLLFVARVTPEEVNEILSNGDLINKMADRIGKQDQKAVKAREKMEEKMKVTKEKKKVAKPSKEDPKPAAKKVVASDKKDVAPAKKAIAPTKKVVKK